MHARLHIEGAIADCRLSDRASKLQFSDSDRHCHPKYELGHRGEIILVPRHKL